MRNVAEDYVLPSCRNRRHYGKDYGKGSVVNQGKIIDNYKRTSRGMLTDF